MCMLHAKNLCFLVHFGDKSIFTTTDVFCHSHTSVSYTHLDVYKRQPECIDEKCKNKLLLAVTLHNIPEGMAVGVIYAGLLSGAEHITEIGAFSLALGIAIQNFPEGAIISLPLCTEGMSKKRAFIYGVLSGAVEPVAAVFTVWAASLIVPLLPYFLSFAAGAMFYVVVEELIPEMSAGKHSNIGTILFSFGFTLMLTLDVALG